MFYSVPWVLNCICKYSINRWFWTTHLFKKDSWLPTFWFLCHDHVAWNWKRLTWKQDNCGYREQGTGLLWFILQYWRTWHQIMPSNYGTGSLKQKWLVNIVLNNDPGKSILLLAASQSTSEALNYQKYALISKVKVQHLVFLYYQTDFFSKCQV